MIEKISFQAFIWYHSWLLRKPYLKQAGNTHLADFVAYRSVLAASDKSVPCGPRYTVYLVNIGVWDWKRKKKNWECWNVVCWNKINLIRDLLKLLWSSLLFAWLQTAELPGQVWWWRVVRCVLQEVQRFALAVKQIKEKTTAFSANREPCLFCSSRQNLSTLSSRTLLIQCNTGCREPLYRSQPECFARQQNRQDVCFLAHFKYGFLNNHKTN